MSKSYICIFFMVACSMCLCLQNLCAQKPAPTTMDLLQNKYWVFKESLRIGSLMYKQYEQNECCNFYFFKKEELSQCRDYYLSDTIVRSYQEDSVGMVKNGKYIVQKKENIDTNVFEIMKLTSDSLVIKLCLDSLHKSIGGGHPVVYTAEKKRFINKMKRKVRARK